jgi:hypothetical protein
MRHGELPVPEDLVRAPVSKLFAYPLFSHRPIVLLLSKKTVRCHSAAEYRLHCSLFYLSHTHHQGDWGLNETAQSSVERAARRLSAHTHISYMRLLCVPHCPRQAIIWKQSRASFALDALLACLSPYAAKALILISLLVRLPPLYLSYVCDACRRCDETLALLCAFRSSTGQTTDLLSFNDIESASSLSIIWCVQSRKRSRLLLSNTSCRHSLFFPISLLPWFTD